MTTNSNSTPIDDEQPPVTDQINAMDDWAAALAEQNAAQNTQSKDDAGSLAASVFAPLTSDTQRINLDLDTLKDVPVQMTVELGRTRLTIKELLQLGQGSVVELSALAGEPLDILINGHLIAQGEVVVVGESYGVRLTDILTPSDRLRRLSTPR
ncbi:Flagellar motor switch protein fliN [Cricetulus griseus]|jgi:flagellar motor switch protein FliN/FliY|uniref:Flagellar motor switch protein fliN n=1 Tax=Cricetulus griseus TaxID=10029 RepID=A0A061HUX2_CRIGR|nr:Flagellar motor switch protein fliN [Cricetulus griseus]